MATSEDKLYAVGRYRRKQKQSL